MRDKEKIGIWLFREEGVYTTLAGNEVGITYLPQDRFDYWLSNEKCNLIERELAFFCY